MMRRVTLAMIGLLGGLAILAGEAVHAVSTASARARVLKENARLVKALGLTDFALFTEARYTRHISQADLFTPFQDAPGAFEHFPAGTLVAPPAQLTRHAGRIATRPTEETKR